MTIRFSNVKQAVDLFWQSVDTTSVNKRLGFNHNVVEKLSHDMKAINDMETILLAKNKASEENRAAFENVASTYTDDINPALLRLELQQLESFQQQKQIFVSTMSQLLDLFASNETISLMLPNMLSQICIGFISMLFGIVVEISGATIRNDEEYHRFYFSMLGAGLWCGLIFIAVGYFGIETTRRKSTCFIVALMALAMSSMMFAVLQMAIGICAMAGDRNVEIKNHRYYFQVPVVTFIFNLLLTLLGFFMVILLGTTVVYSSIATCCQSQPNFLRVNIYEPVRTPSSGYPQPMQLPSQMPYTNTESVYCAPQEYQETAKGEMQPLMLMPNNQFVSVQYQTSGFPHQNAQYTSTSQQTIFEHGQATAANENAA